MSEEGIAAGAPAPTTPFQQTDRLVDRLARYAVEVQDGNLVDFAGRIVKAIANERIASAAARAEMLAKFQDLVKRLANMAETAVVEIDDYSDDLLRTRSFTSSARELVREARAAIGEGRRLSTEPFGRAATEQEVESHLDGIEWCMYCFTDCPLSHHDALCVCDHYDGPAKKGSKK